jgi:poly-beta-1,6-N-acetyl-D-glucosamine synthase
MSPIPGQVYFIVFIIFFSYFVLSFAYYLALGLISFIEQRKRFGEDSYEDYSSLVFSIYTLPVSILIPAHNEETWILDSVKSALNLSYPELEIIVIDDGSTDKTLELLNNEFRLEPLDRLPEQLFSCGKIRQAFRSAQHPNLTVVSKDSGFKKAGALNVGLEFARYKYICVLDADTILEPDALLKVMAHAVKDPDNVIGIGSYFGLVNGFKVKDGRIIEHSFSRNPLVVFQNLEYIRSFVFSRPAWSRLNATPVVAGGFAVWRKDIVLEVGGFSTEYTTEDVEFTFRIQDYILENKKRGYKILMLPYLVGWTEGPQDISHFFSQRCLWQKTVNEAVWKYRHIFLNIRHGLFAFFTLPYYVFVETLGAFLEAASIILVLWGWIAGILQVDVFLAVLALIVLANALISLLSVLFISLREREIFRPHVLYAFLIFSFTELFSYHLLMLGARLWAVAARKTRN